MIWETNWQGIVVFEDIMLPNNWTIEVEFDFITENNDLQVIAFDRMKYLIYEVFEHSTFINVNNPWLTTLKNLKSYKITLPEEPIDSAIAVALFSKMIAVTKDVFVFDSIKIKSQLGDNMQSIFLITDFSGVPWIHDNPVKSLTGEPAWFLREDAGCTDFVYKTKKKTEVIKDKQEWSELDLGWDSLENPTPIPESTNKTSTPPVAKPWKPRVITGGKNET